MYCTEQKGESRRNVKKCVDVNKDENTTEREGYTRKENKSREGREEKEHSTIGKQGSILRENEKQKGNGKGRNKKQTDEKENEEQQKRINKDELIKK